MTTTFARRKAGHVCVECTGPLPEGTTHISCATCLHARREHWRTQHWTPEYRAMMQRAEAVLHPAPAPDPAPQLVAHCGQWWPIRALPFACPACAKELFPATLEVSHVS